MEPEASWAALVLRVAGGLVFIVHGLPVLFPGTAPGTPVRTRLVNAIAGMRFPFPTGWMYLVGGVEFFGGLLLLAGLFTAWVAAALAVVMLPAVYWRQRKDRFRDGAEQPFVLLCMMAALVVLGDGEVSLAAVLALS